MRVAIPILAMVVFGVAVVVIAGANSGNAAPTPPAASLGYPPATLAGADFAAGASGRGITQTLGRVGEHGHQIVAVDERRDPDGDAEHVLPLQRLPRARR